MKSTSCIHGISSYIKKVEAIADQCGEKKAAAVAETKDEFILTKMRMYMLIEDIRTGVQERSTLMKRRGICSETITKGHEHRQKLTELQSLLPKLQQLHKKATKKQKSNANDAKSQENAMRWQDIRVLTAHVKDTRDLVEGQAQDEDMGAPSSQMLGLGLRDAANARGDPNTQRPFTEEEQQVLTDMRTRDKQIDQQVGEIGSIVERMVPIAEQIGFTAEKQKQQADVLSTAVDKNREEIDRQSEATKALIKYEKSTTQCCQMVLGLILLCVVGFIFHQIGIG